MSAKVAFAFAKGPKAHTDLSSFTLTAKTPIVVAPTESATLNP